jgi:hypothetical protein
MNQAPNGRAYGQKISDYIGNYRSAAGHQHPRYGELVLTNSIVTAIGAVSKFPEKVVDK